MSNLVTDYPWERFTTEDFISEVEKCPSIWDHTSDDWCNKPLRAKTWDAFTEKFTPNYGDMTQAEKSNMAAAFKKRWKGIRDSYIRELQKQRKAAKSDSSTKPVVGGRRQYRFFGRLGFLEQSARRTVDVDSASEAEEMNNEDKLEKIDNQEPTTFKIKHTCKKKPFKRSREREDRPDETLNILKRKHQHPSTEVDDADMLFLLSMYKDLKSLPDNVKLNVKCQLLGVLASASDALQTKAS